MHSRADGYGVHLNPLESERRAYDPGDMIIVLAEDGAASELAPPAGDRSATTRV